MVYPAGQLISPKQGRRLSMQNIVAALAKKETPEPWKNVMDLEK
jgi:hypothetical protein